MTLFFRHPDELPALYALIFITPKLILDTFVTKNNVRGVFGEGIPGLWPLLLEAENIPVKLNYEVKVSASCTLIQNYQSLILHLVHITHRKSKRSIIGLDCHLMMKTKSLTLSFGVDCYQIWSKHLLTKMKNRLNYL
jgi:hypothetical protein